MVHERSGAKPKAATKAKPAPSKKKGATLKRKPAPSGKKPAKRKKEVAPPKARPPAGALVTAQGVDLIDLVIAKVKSEGRLMQGMRGKKPTPIPPDALEALTFPDGSPLSPSLRRWLAFDASWLGWFGDVRRPVFQPRKLGQYAKDEYDLDWGYGELEATVGGDCFGVRGGSDSRRFLYVGRPDRTGEHPILLIDTDDSPYLGVEYPGIDVYLAIHTGVLEHSGAYGSLANHPRYAARMKEHAAKNLGGELSIDLGYGHGQFAGEGD